MSYVLDAVAGAALANAYNAHLARLPASVPRTPASPGERGAGARFALVAPGLAGTTAHGSAFSALPPRTRWRSRSQGDISPQQWLLLREPWRLDEHARVKTLVWQDFINSQRVYKLSRKDRRKLDRLRRRNVKGEA